MAMYNRKYTDEIIEFARANCKGLLSRELADLINKEFGTNFTETEISRFKSRYKLRSGIDCTFKKGLTVHNKGKKMPKELYEKCKATMFKKGQQPPTTKPIGTERIRTDGRVEVKVENGKRWQPKQRVVWQKHYGEIPKGGKIMFLDGNNQNFDINNLKLVTSREMACINKKHLISEFAEITELNLNLVKLQIGINDKKRKNK